MRRCSFAGLLLLLVSALPATASSDAWLDRAWQSDDGLPDNAVSGVAQTSDGFLWVGTAGGLMRFDGARFEEVPISNIEGVPNRVVRAMLLDRLGNVWLAMDRGVVVRLNSTEVRAFSGGLPDSRIISMADDRKGALCLGYASGIFSRLKDGRARVFTGHEGVPSGGPCCVATDPEGNSWASKGQNLGLLTDTGFQTVFTTGSTVWCIAQRHSGGIWFCAGGRLWHCSRTQRPEPDAMLPGNPETLEPHVLLEDRAGRLWLGTTADGLFYLNGGKFELLPTSHREIDCLSDDQEGNLWVGTGGGGLNRLRPRVIELLGTESGLPFESVRSVCEDSTGVLWATTQNGLLACLQDGVWQTISRSTNWPGGHASCVASDRMGGVWIGTHDHGLYHWVDGHCQGWRSQDGLASESIRSLLPSSAGDLWVATDSPSQLQCLHKGVITTLELPRRIRSLRAMAEDAQTNIWVASAEGSLLRANLNGIINETPTNTTRPLSIRCLYATPEGSVWVGYAGWGLGRFKDGRLARVTTEHGLYDDYISQLVLDGRGWMWCAGNRGMFRTRFTDLQDVAEGRLSHLSCIVYGRDEGLPNLQANYENFPGAFRARDGRLWFPMRTGLAVVHTGNVLANPEPPPVLLERVAIDGHLVATYDRALPARVPLAPNVMDLRLPNRLLIIPPAHHKLDIEFTALSFTAPENVRFEYRLEGIDEDWVDAGAQRKASYSRLPEGDYTFQVKACNNAGIWNETGASLALTVTPFLWQTWPFRLAAGTLFTMAIIGLVRYGFLRHLRHQLRVLEQQAALHKERARIAKDIHDDLGANLTQIALLGELAQQDSTTPEKAAERTNRISTTARQAIRSLDEIVWAVNPRNDTLAHLIDYSGQFALDYLRLAGIRCRLDFPEQAPPRELSTDVRHNLFLAIKEALNNIVKHAQATEVWVRVQPESARLNISIEDNGRGFNGVRDDAMADGLRNMKQRMSDLGGQCFIESRIGAGTKVVFELPWGAN